MSFTSIFSYLIIALCGNLIVIVYFISKRIYKVEVALMLIFLAGIITKIFVTGDLASGKTLLLLTSNLGLAMSLSRVKRFKAPIYLTLLFVLTFYISYMVTGIDAKLIHHQVSKNHISVNIVFACSLLLIFLNYKKKRPYLNILISLIGLIIGIWTQGRGGIIALGAMFALISIDSLKHMKKSHAILYVGLIFASFIGVFADFERRQLLLSVFYRKEFLSDVRFNIIDLYFENMDFMSFLSGMDLKNIFDVYMVENIHNSFLSIHANLGLYGLLLITAYIITLFKAYKRDKILFIVFLSIMLRAWSDTILMYYFDFILYYIMIEVFKKPLKHNAANTNYGGE
jgi:hypothetical protein